MLDHLASTQRAVHTGGLIDSSARPGAAVAAARPERDRLEVRTRAGLATALHRLASALEPRPRDQRVAGSTPACS